MFIERTDDDLRDALQSYAYRTQCTSLLFPLFDRVWYTPILRLFPTWFHANAITLIGASLSLGAFLLCTLASDQMRWGWMVALAGVGYWIYHTLDNVDGPQARRTGTSSPVGEVLDHCADAFTVFLIPLGLMPFFDLPPLTTLTVVALASLTFWVSMWEVHHRGLLITGWLSDFEACFVSCSIMVIAGLAGGDLFTRPIVTDFSAIDAIVVVTVLGFSWQSLTCLARQRHRRLVLQLLPVVGTQALFILWYPASGGAGLHAVGFLVGCAAARMTFRLIVSRVFGETYRPFDPLATEVALGGLIVLLLVPVPGWLLPVLLWGAVALLLVPLVVEALRTIGVIRQLLGIELFRVH